MELVGQYGVQRRTRRRTRYSRKTRKRGKTPIRGKRRVKRKTRTKKRGGSAPELQGLALATTPLRDEELMNMSDSQLEQISEDRDNFYTKDEHDRAKNEALMRLKRTIKGEKAKEELAVLESDPQPVQKPEPQPQEPGWAMYQPGGGEVTVSKVANTIFKCNKIEYSRYLSIPQYSQCYFALFISHIGTQNYLAAEYCTTLEDINSRTNRSIFQIDYLTKKIAKSGSILEFKNGGDGQTLNLTECPLTENDNEHQVKGYNDLVSALKMESVEDNRGYPIAEWFEMSGLANPEDLLSGLANPDSRSSIL